MKPILCLLLALALTASVAAGGGVLIYNDLEKPGDGWIDQDSVEPDSLPDTTRFYAKVDTCLTCPLGWDLRRFSFGLECLMRSSSDYRQPPDTTFTTTWLPKVDTVGYWLAICGDTTYHQDTVSVRLLVEALYQDHTPDCEKRWPKVWPDTVHKQTVEEK